ncbi:spore gernimation protein [Gordoniibacillus kamchatkensis]|uniref:Spore gernimation protein n=1 Tax=Gordoniibacillus kamchatkensis TaxID=1590651 RepID=A0ABR5AIA8_9BACL|nr:endospore germination permease [Paenibacillus sp. VKM B-2647]KIL40488.1 spore gernimation protein [Paenibacillus sp. VKM B-2647]
MKKYAFNEITPMQYTLILFGTQVGTGVLALPRVLAEKSGTDGWISIILAWALNSVAGLLILSLFKRYPDDTMPDLLVRLFGKWLGKLILLPLLAYFAFFSWTSLVRGLLYVKAWFLPKTPDYIVMLLLTVPVFMVVRNGLRVQARYSEIVFYMTMWMPFFLLFLLSRGHWIHMLPLFKEGWWPIVKALPTTLLSFLGIEVLYVLHPFLQKKQYAVHGFMIANGMTGLLYLLVVIVCYVYFSPDAITLYNQPVLSLLKEIEFRFLERFDMVFLALYLLVISRSWVPYIFSTVFCASQLLGKQDHAVPAVCYMIATIVLVFLIHPTWNESDMWVQYQLYAAPFLVYLLPLILYLYVRGLEAFRGRQTP